MSDERLTDEQVIARLAQAGVTASNCPVCGRVKETEGGLMGFHYLAESVDICPGSGKDLLEADKTFKKMTKGLHLDLPTSTADYADLAAKDARAKLEFLMLMVEKGNRVVGTSGEEFCGCVPCIVREVLFVVWPYAAQGEVTDIINHLTQESTREGLSKPERKAAKHIAQQIAEQQYGSHVE